MRGKRISKLRQGVLVVLLDLSEYLFHRNFGGTSIMGEQIHVANNINKEVRVAILPDQGMELADEAFDAAVGLIPYVGKAWGVVKAGAGIADSIVDLSKGNIHKGSYGMISALIQGCSIVAGAKIKGWRMSKTKKYLDRIADIDSDFISKMQKETESIIAMINQISKPIPHKEYTLVNETGLGDFFSLHGIASLVQRPTVTLLFINFEDCITTQFRTHSDASWIINNSDIVRSRYGSIWEENPSEGKFKWGSNPQDVPAYQ